MLDDHHARQSINLLTQVIADGRKQERTWLVRAAFAAVLTGFSFAAVTSLEQAVGPLANGAGIVAAASLIITLVCATQVIRGFMQAATAEQTLPLIVAPSRDSLTRHIEDLSKTSKAAKRGAMLSAGAGACAAVAALAGEPTALNPFQQPSTSLPIVAALLTTAAFLNSRHHADIAVLVVLAARA